MKIHAALIEAMRDIAKVGIAKTSNASLGGANVRYRGIEAAMNEMSVILIKCGITVTPSYSDLVMFERSKAEGKAIRFATIRGAFTFTAAEDGSSVKCEAYGEAMDSGDKAVTKAQSVAFRTALFQQFVVPTMAMDPEEGGDDEGILNDECREAVELAKTEDALRAVSKKYVPLFNKAHDRDGYAEFVKLVQARGAELKATAQSAKEGVPA
jgi:hypothetical protein